MILESKDSTRWPGTQLRECRLQSAVRALQGSQDLRIRVEWCFDYHGKVLRQRGRHVHIYRHDEIVPSFLFDAQKALTLQQLLDQAAALPATFPVRQTVINTAGVFFRQA